MSITDNTPDLSAFDIATGANDGFKLELLDKTGAKSEHWIKVLGKDSSEYERVFGAQNRRRIARMQKRGIASALTPEEMEDDGIDLLAAVTKEWSFKLPDGSAYPCNAKNAAALYRGAKYIREQVDAAVHERENFIKS